MKLLQTLSKAAENYTTTWQNCDFNIFEGNSGIPVIILVTKISQAVKSHQVPRIKGTQ